MARSFFQNFIFHFLNFGTSMTFLFTHLFSLYSPHLFLLLLSVGSTWFLKELNWKHQKKVRRRVTQHKHDNTIHDTRSIAFKEFQFVFHLYLLHTNNPPKPSNQKSKMGKQEDINYSATAVPAPGYDKNDQNVPTNHQRFYCEKCQLSYDLPHGATSWRCSTCQTFNTTTPAECPCCVIQ